MAPGELSERPEKCWGEGGGGLGGIVMDISFRVNINISAFTLLPL